MSDFYLIVGLGNPGGEYARTRHNVGFVVVEQLARRWKTELAFEKKFNAKVAKVQRDEKQTLLCQPQTYMNSSGDAVGALTDFYRVPAARVLVIVDDADLVLGELRLRPSGSNGGHHGLESIESRLNTREYARLRIGIGRKDAARQITSHVLGRFDSTESAVMDKVLSVAADQAECWLDAGIEKAMNQFNGIAAGLDNERKAQ